MNEQRDLIVVPTNTYEDARKLGIAHLRMAVWYSPESKMDREFGQDLFNGLTQIGCKTSVNGVVLSPEGILPGQETKYAAAKIFEHSDIVHMILSRQAVTQNSRIFFPGMNAAVSESEYKPEGKMFILPIRLNDVPLPSMLSRLWTLDLFKQDQFSPAQQLLRAWQAAAVQHPR